MIDPLFVCDLTCVSFKLCLGQKVYHYIEAGKLHKAEDYFVTLVEN